MNSSDIPNDALADARHYIPAEALDVDRPIERVPVNIAEIVAEVRRSFGLIEAEDDSPSSAVTSTEEAFASVPSARPSLDAPADLPSAPAFSPLPEAEVEEAEVEEAEADEPEIDDAEVDEAGAHEAGAHEAGADEEEALLETEMEAEGYQTDPLSDDEVFHRNRDQLYHPPDEPGRRTLLITAGILTFCVLVIIVYLLLDQSEPRELPGSAPVGNRAVTCEPQMRV